MRYTQDLCDIFSQAIFFGRWTAVTSLLHGLFLSRWANGSIERWGSALDTFLLVGEDARAAEEKERIDYLEAEVRLSRPVCALIFTDYLATEDYPGKAPKSPDLAWVRTIRKRQNPKEYSQRNKRSAS